MPELPEVETVKQGLKPALQGHRLTRVQTRRGDLRIPFPPGFVQHLTGRKVAKLGGGPNTSWPISTMARRSSSIWA